MTQRVLIDACVLFPPLVRTIVFEVASAGLFSPLWSPRIFDEWRLAVVRKHGIGTEFEVIAAQTLLQQRFPDACVLLDPELEDQILLPDPADVHVLCAAITGQADALMTFNLRDFPQRIAGAHGVHVVHPDGCLWSLLSSHESEVTRAAARALDAGEIDADRRRAVLKRARLPRFAKALEAL